MIALILAIIMAIVCPNHTNTTQHNCNTQVTTLDDTGGETGYKPPTPPPPPPPGQP